jgi:hypothetical protein
MNCRDMFWDPINPLPRKCAKCGFPDLDFVPQPYFLVKSRAMSPNELALAEKGNFFGRSTRERKKCQEAFRRMGARSKTSGSAGIAPADGPKQCGRDARAPARATRTSTARQVVGTVPDTKKNGVKNGVSSYSYA